MNGVVGAQDLISKQFLATNYLAPMLAGDYWHITNLSSLMFLAIADLQLIFIKILIKSQLQINDQILQIIFHRIQKACSTKFNQIIKNFGMFKIDQNIIQDRISGVSFSFMTEQEISKLSVVEVRKLQAFDQLGNPYPEGLHDKRMGVSPFDKNSMCPTCGLTSNFCPGHHGHIELVAPIYNPFMIKDLYRLMKSKCFHCHRLRIHESKLNVYVHALKLIKAGEMVGSQRIKNYFLSLAKDLTSQIQHEKDINDPKKVQQLQKLFAQMSNKPVGSISKDEVIDQLNSMAKRIRVEKEKFEYQIMSMLQNIQANQNPEETNLTHKSGPTSIMQKFQIELIKEIWSNVVTTKCPHCKQNSPAFRKDGYTKMFVKPLSGRTKNAQLQSSKLSAAEVESQTVASTKLHESRKSSNINDDDLENHESEEELEGLEVEGIDEEFKEGGQQKYISPLEVQDHIKKLWNREKDLLDLMYGKFEPIFERTGPYEVQSLGQQLFFLKKIVVPPTRFRPESEGGHGGGASGGSGKAYLHTHSAMLLKIMTANEAMKDALLDQNKSINDQAQTKSGKLGITTQKWIQLQESVNCFMDSSMASKNADKEQGGVRQLLEKKEGMFRMKMMGKRVNYGGRSVISPDPYITTDQIGVPVFMARKLTFPEAVSSFNAERLGQAVRNGAKIHPGANMIEDEETGSQVHLEYMSAEQRDGLAKLLNVGRKIVYRHLSNNDPLLVNRQPTLHKPSIMAHRCRVLPKEQTIRMHYANCNTYNADFDGDEMNLHLPQSYQAVAEAYELMATHRQYCVPTSGKPLRGLIQDSVVSGVFMTSKDTFLSKDQYNQLVYIGLRELIEMDKIGKIETLQPTILKPKPLWTGKQVISTLLKNIVNKEQEYKQKGLTGLNASFKSKLAAKEWGSMGSEEGDVLFRDNEHLRGALDKSAFGASDFGLVHAFYEVYGSEKAGELLTSLARVFAVFLQTHGFTCGLDDLMIDRQYNKHRRMQIEQGHKEGLKAAAEFCGIKDYEPEDMNLSNRVIFQSKKNFDKDFERLTKMSLPINPFENKKCIQADNKIRIALAKKMSTAGTDLSIIDAELDSAMQGKMNDATSKVLKEIIPKGLIKKFPQNNLCAMVLTGAKGGVVNQTQISALLGQQSLEGRRVPKMQNGKTLPCYLPYDPNPRSSGYISDRFISGLRPQDFYFHCMAGREGLIDTAVKTSRSGYLQRCLIKQLESLIVNYDMTVRDNDGSIVQFNYGDDGIDVINTKYLDKFEFLELNFNSLISQGQHIIRSVNSEAVPAHKRETKRIAKQIKKETPGMSSQEALNKAGDPLLNLFHPQKYFGAISETMDAGINEYVKKQCAFVKLDQNIKSLLKRKYNPIEPDTFRSMYYMKYMKSLVHPGENVGTIAAQSVGEPSTQMTLNTFHLAGHGAGNMTLGIPRLKEILMTTPYNIKTPIMKLYFRKDIPLDMAQLQKFSNKFQKLKLSDIVTQIKVNQSIIQESNGFSRVYKVQLAFDATEDLKNNLGIDQKKLAQLFADHYIPSLMSETFKQIKKADGDIPKVGMAATTKQKKGHGQKSGNENDDDEEKAIKEATSSKKLNDQAIDDEDDKLSDHEMENQQEMGEIDGNAVKFSKVVRGYEDADDESEDEEQQENNDQQSDSSVSVPAQEQTEASKISRKRTDSGASAIEKYTKPLRETHSKYLQYLRDIDFDKKKNIATINISFPLSFKKVLMLTIAEQTLSKVLVRSVPGIEKCTLIQPKKDNEEPCLVVQGINFDAFYPHSDVIDVNRIETNHSYALKAKYGVEAMRANIMKEVQMVFGVYGISVDKRHLSLISDFMTFNGDYRAFNRIGMEESSSPFLKMSYETTMKYLVSASSAQEKDDMSAPSSAIVMGQIPRVGTGMFDLIQSSPF